MRNLIFLLYFFREIYKFEIQVKPKKLHLRISIPVSHVEYYRHSSCDAPPSLMRMDLALQMNGVISRPDQTGNYEKIHAVRTRTLPYARRTGQESREEHHTFPKHQNLLKTIKNPWI